MEALLSHHKCICDDRIFYVCVFNVFFSVLSAMHNKRYIHTIHTHISVLLGYFAMLCIARTIVSQDVRLSPSVTRRYSIRTAKHIIKLFTVE